MEKWKPGPMTAKDVSQAMADLKPHYRPGPDPAPFEHLIVLAHHACRTLDYPVALQNAITNAEKELAKWTTK
jgi:hypothetical protein